MSEICPECMDRLCGTRGAKWKYIISKESDLCEVCGQYRPVIVVSRWVYWRRKLVWLLIPAVFAGFCLLHRRREHLDGGD